MSATTFRQNLKLVLKVIEVRLRFIFVLVAVGLLIGYWATIKNHWDKWTRPTVAAAEVDADHEFYCPMHPLVIRHTYEPNGEVPKCPICGMPLSLRRRGEAPALPPGVTGRVQLSPERIQLAGIQTAEVQYRPMARRITTVGEVAYDESRLSRVTSRVSGYVERLLVDKTFARVSEGDPLAEIYSPDLYSAAQELVLLDRQKLSPELAQSARKRLALLGVSEPEIAALAASGKAVPKLVVRSPRSGYVIGKPIVAGSRVEEGMTLLDVADLSTVWIEADVFEKDIAALRPGQSIEAVVEALPNQVFHGKVSRVYPRVETATRTNRVRFELANPRDELRPGMYATVKIDVPLDPLDPLHSSPGEPRVRTVSQSGPDEYLTVPERAIIDTGQQQIVYVEREPGLFEGVEVKLGPRMGDYYPVLRGLSGGERIAAAGAFLVDAETRLNPAAASTYFGASGGPQSAGRGGPTAPASGASGGPQSAGRAGPAAPAKGAERAEPKAAPAKPVELTPEQLDNLTKLPEGDRELARAQRVCPITGQALGSMGKPIKIVLQGQAVFLCCRGCVSKANKDPAGTVKKAEESRKENDQSPSTND